MKQSLKINIRIDDEMSDKRVTELFYKIANLCAQNGTYIEDASLDFETFFDSSIGLLSIAAARKGRR